jgi:hypothetical protein
MRVANRSGEVYHGSGNAGRCEVKRIVWLAGALLVVADLYGATVVLKGGKRLDVANYTVNGSYVTVEYTGGRRESYPLAAVDLQATRKAGGVKTEAPGAAKPEGPHSPFLGAKSSGGSGGLVVTDADVKHTETPGTGDETKKEETKEESGDGTEDSQVVLVGYEKKKVGDKDWEITATVANVGKTSVQNVSATMRILDSKGKPLTVGSGTLREARCRQAGQHQRAGVTRSGPGPGGV